MSTAVIALRSRVVRLAGPLTPLGRAVALVGIVGWIVAVVFDWEEFAVVAATCTVALALALLFTLGTTVLRVETRLDPARVRPGDRAVAELDVTNLAGRRMLPFRLEVPVGAAVAVADVPSLAVDETFEETIVIPTVRRCVLQIGPTRSVRGDPLGLMRREVVWDDLSELFVHPVVVPLTGLSSGWLRDLEGQRTNDRSPSDVELHTLREYVPGDDRRHVHWKTSARIGKLMVRQFVDNRRSHLGIVLDTNPASYADADEFELAVSMAASLGLKAVADGQEVSCVAGSYGMASHTGQALLDGFARVEFGVPTISMQDTATRAAPMLVSASVVALVTGAALATAEIQLATQRFGYDIHALALRAAHAEQAGFRRSPALTAITANSLESFPRVMWGVTA